MKTTTIPKTGFFIGVTCPGCGAGLELQADFFSLVCGYCGSALRLVMPDTAPAYYIRARKQKWEIRSNIDRYLKQNDLPLTRSDFQYRAVYYPYWKLDAIQVRATRRKYNPNKYSPSTSTQSYHGFGEGLFMNEYGSSASAGHDDYLPRVKLSPYTLTRSAGPALAGIPASIGMRTQYIKAEPLAAEKTGDDFEYLAVEQAWDEIVRNVRKSVINKAQLYAAQGENRRSEIFHPIGSLVYFPYFVAFSDTAGEIDAFIIDGLTGRVVHAGEGRAEFLDAYSSGQVPSNKASLKVELHRCGNCGVDLPANRSSIYICHNCQTVTQLDRERCLEDGINSTELMPAGRNDDQYPFWLLKLPSHIIDQAVSRGISETAPEYLLIPGFKMGNFEAMKRLTGRITNAASSFMRIPVDRDSSAFKPVTVGLSEALTLAEVIIYSNQLTKNQALTAEGVQVIPESVGLVYIPFHPQNYFLIDSVTGDVTFEKSVIR